MKLQEIKEARHIASSGQMYGTAIIDDGQFMVTAPFSSSEEAKRYIEWEMKEFDLEDEHRAEVIFIEPPGW